MRLSWCEATIVVPEPQKGSNIIFAFTTKFKLFSTNLIGNAALCDLSKAPEFLISQKLNSVLFKVQILFDSLFVLKTKIGSQVLVNPDGTGKAVFFQHINSSKKSILL